MISRPGAAVLVTLALAGSARADRLRTGIDPDVVAPIRDVGPAELAPYNKVYLNRCAGGCTINPGPSSSIADTWGVSSQKVLSAFPYGDTAWNQVVGCVKDLMSPFKVDVVTSNPGSTDHFEIMIAGAGTDLNSNYVNYGGVAPGTGSCTGILDDALVFAFAKAYGTTPTTCDDHCVNEICATAAQEIGHVWNRMDHVTLASDPMTYFDYSGRRYYQNMAAQCGSDCVNGQSPTGMTCTGITQQAHDCICLGPTQNSYQEIGALFGFGPGTPPTIDITSPKLNEAVQQGFPVVADIEDDSGLISRVELKIDGDVVLTLTDPPFDLAAPNGLADGAHHVEVVAYDPHQTAGSDSVDIVIGKPCEDNDDCPFETDVCVGGRCAAGPDVDGGLGTTCTDSSGCKSNQCVTDGTDSYCVESCESGQCPDGFGCLDTGSETGVCWPGVDDGGGCGCQSSRGGPAGMALALFVMVVTCKRRRSR
jgi:hypothetical protein